jgi:hypothetical protein
MVLGLSRPVTEMSCQCLGLTTLPLSCADCLEIWEPLSPGTIRACPMGLLFLIAKYCKIILSCSLLLPRGTILFWIRRSEHHHILTSSSQTPFLAAHHPRMRRFCKERNLSGWSGIVKFDRSVSQIIYLAAWKRHYPKLEKDVDNDRSMLTVIYRSGLGWRWPSDLRHFPLSLCVTYIWYALLI